MASVRSSVPKRSSVRPDPEASSTHALDAKPPRIGVAELLRQLSELEAKLAERDRGRSSDAELIGTLIAEVAERDRRIGQLEAKRSEESERTRGLERALRRSDSVFERVLRQLEASGGANPEATRELRELLSVTLAAIDATRAMTRESAIKLEEARDAVAVVGPRDAVAGLDATLDETRNVREGAATVDRSIARVVDRLREIERREKELAALRDALLAEATELLAGVHHLRDDMGRLATRDRGTKRPSKLPKRR